MLPCLVGSNFYLNQSVFLLLFLQGFPLFSVFGFRLCGHLASFSLETFHSVLKYTYSFSDGRRCLVLGLKIADSVNLSLAHVVGRLFGGFQSVRLICDTLLRKPSGYSYVLHL